MTNEPRAGDGLDPEVLAAYLDKRLPPDERAAVEAKLAADPDSYELLVELIHANEALPDEASQDDDATAPVERPEEQGAVVPLVPRPQRTRGWAIAGGVLAVAAALVLVARLQPELLRQIRNTPSDPLLAELVQAVGARRTVQGRLSGGFGYGQYAAPLRGAAEGLTQNLELLAAAAKLSEAADRKPTPAATHALGLAQLLLGNDETAVSLLEKAQAGDPENAGYRSDLATAFAMRAIRSPKADDWPLALAWVERAVARDPNLLEALFNRAWILEVSGLRDQAITAWRAYLERDAGSPWAAEARQHLAALEKERADAGGDLSAVSIIATNALDRMDAEAVARVDPALVIVWMQAVLLDRWLQDSLSPVFQQGRSRLADLATAPPDDAWIKDTLDCLDRHPDRAAREGFRAFITGVTHAVRDEATAAHGLFLIARQRLEGVCTPLALSAAYHATSLPSQQGRAIEVLAAVSAARSAAVERGYLGLQGQLWWRQGLTHVRQGRLEQGIHGYLSALDAFSRARQRDNAANMNSLLAEAYRTLGDMKVAWRYHRASIEMTRSVADPRIRHQIYSQHSLSSLQAGLPEAAVVFQAAMIDNDARWGNVGALAMAHTQRARAYVQLAHFDLARVDADLAFALLPRINDPSLRARVEAEVLASRAESLDGADVQPAALAFADARQAFTRTGSPDRAAAMTLARGKLLWRAGQHDEAVADWTSGLNFLRQSRKSMRDESLRLVQATSMRRILENLADAALERGESADVVLGLTESSRFQTTAEWLSAGTMEPLGLEAIRSSLSADTALIYYLNLRTASYAVVLRNNRAIVTLRPLTHAGDDPPLRAAVANGGKGSTGREAEAWYDALMRPIAADLEGARALVIVPGPATNGVPWAALTDRTTGIPLLQTFRLSIVPSGTVYALLKGRERPAARAVRVEAFGVGQAPADESLPALARAEVEAKAVASTYPGGRAWVGAEATSRRFSDALQRADIVHFAGHSVYNPDYPMTSRLLMAPDPERGSRLFADDISRLSNVTARIVVLAACRSAGSGAGIDEAALGLTRTFLAAGVLSVIATIRDVDDAASEQLMKSVHAGLSRGLSASAALQRAQLEMRDLPQALGSTDWTAFAVYGLP